MWNIDNWTNISDCWGADSKDNFFNLTFATNLTTLFNDVPRNSTLNVPYTVSLITIQFLHVLLTLNWCQFRYNLYNFTDFSKIDNGISSSNRSCYRKFFSYTSLLS